MTNAIGEVRGARTVARRKVEITTTKLLGAPVEGMKAQRLFYTEIFSASPEDRIVMIRRGVPATDAKRIIKDLGVEQRLFYDALGLKTATVNRKVKSNASLSSNESERLLGVAKLVGQLETIVAEAGASEGFDATEWVSRWLREPLPAFGGERPIDFLDTMEGQSLVSDALARIQSGAYA